MVISGQFNDSLPPIMDGVAVAAYNYAYWMNRNHGPSFAVGPRVPGTGSDEDFILRYLSLKLSNSTPYRLGVPRIDPGFNAKIDEIPFDIVHAHCPFVSGNYALSLAHKRKIPMVATFHSKYRDDFASVMKLEITIDQAVAMVVKFYEEADAVWVPNEAIIDTFREYGYTGPVEYVPNGSDIGIQVREERDSLAPMGRDILKTDTASPVLLYLGQLRWIKNLKLIIESAALLRDKGVAFQLRFVGKGSDEEEIRQLIAKKHLEKHIILTGPIYDRDHIRSAMAASDLFVFPSLYDNASLATREAAGFFVPTVFAEGATTANGIIHGKNGFLGKNNPADFAGLLEELILNAGTREKAGTGAHEFLYKSWEEIAAVAHEKYLDIIDRYKFRQLQGILGN